MAGRLPLAVRAVWPDDMAGVTRPDFGELDPELGFDLALCVLCGPLAEPRPGWPPDWPLDEDFPPAGGRDAELLALLAEYLKLDKADWNQLVGQARHLIGSPEFKRITGLVSSALERVDSLNADQLRRLLGPDLISKYIEPATSREKRSRSMEHKDVDLVRAKASDETGSFEALASVFHNIDDQGDKVLAGAFTDTLCEWRLSGRQLPIVVSHRSDDPMAFVGEADPNEVRETTQGLLVKGQLDLSNPLGVQTHKLLRSGALGRPIPKM